MAMAIRIWCFRDGERDRDPCAPIRSVTAASRPRPAGGLRSTLGGRLGWLRRRWVSPSTGSRSAARVVRTGDDLTIIRGGHQSPAQSDRSAGAGADRGRPAAGRLTAPTAPGGSLEVLTSTGAEVRARYAVPGPGGHEDGAYDHGARRIGTRRPCATLSAILVEEGGGVDRRSRSPRRAEAGLRRPDSASGSPRTDAASGQRRHRSRLCRLAKRRDTVQFVCIRSVTER